MCPSLEPGPWIIRPDHSLTASELVLFIRTWALEKEQEGGGAVGGGLWATVDFIFTPQFFLHFAAEMHA